MWTAEVKRVWRRKGLWHPGSTLFHCSPGVEINNGGFLDSHPWVMIGYTPKAVDHGQPEHSAFYCNSKGGPIFGLDNGDEINTNFRVVGDVPHTTAQLRIFNDLGYHLERTDDD